MTSIYDFTLQSLDGKQLSLREFEGRALLIVNVASQCGLTPQYEALQDIYDRYESQGFSVLAFPCNQFGHQEPGTASDIQSFVSEKFNVTFPMFSKLDVNGDQAHPLYQFLKQEQKGENESSDIEWNFAKFLIDKSGQVIARFAPTTSPEQIESEIAKLCSEG